MMTATGDNLSRSKSGLARFAIDHTVNLAHRSAAFRSWVIDRVAHRLERSYDEWQADGEALILQTWFGHALRPFLDRLIRERPRAAQALVRLACGNMADILSGRGQYHSLTEFVIRQPFFRRFREKQREIEDWRAPCMLIDHPEMFRALCAEGHWYPAKNMPDGYLDGDIAQALDAGSRSWNERLRDEPSVPACVMEQLERLELASPACGCIQEPTLLRLPRS